MTTAELADQLREADPHGERAVGVSVDGVPKHITLVVRHEDAVELVLLG
jgi:hypothetical protein